MRYTRDGSVSPDTHSSGSPSMQRVPTPGLCSKRSVKCFILGSNGCSLLNRGRERKGENQVKATDWKHISNIITNWWFIWSELIVESQCLSRGLTWRRWTAVRTSRGSESDSDTLRTEGRSWWRSELWGQNWPEGRSKNTQKIHIGK